MSPSPKICIASDSLLIGEALSVQLQSSFCKQINLFFYERDLLEFIELNKQALIVLYSRLRDIAMYDLLDKIKRVSKSIKIVLIDNNFERLNYFLSTKKEVCRGVLFHDIGTGELLHCLTEVANSRDYISTSIKAFRSKRNYMKIATDVVILSKREKEIFKLIGDGYSSLQIAGKLFISATTINNHKTNICSKLGISRKELYSAAIKYKEYMDFIRH